MVGVEATAARVSKRSAIVLGGVARLLHHGDVFEWTVKIFVRRVAHLARVNHFVPRWGPLEQSELLVVALRVLRDLVKHRAANFCRQLESRRYL